VDGPDEPRRLRVIVERPSYLTDEDVEICIDHEDIGPDLAKQVGLGDDVRPFGEQDAQHGEGFRRQMDVFTIAQQLPRVGIEVEGGEPHSHGRLQDLENPS